MAVAAVLLVSLTVVPAASAGSPWWRMTSSATPTNLRSEPGLAAARSEVQEVTVAATGGEFILADMTKGEVANGEFFNSKGEFKFEKYSFNAEASVVQTGLEKLYGAGNVEVTGGPGDEKGTKPYAISFKGGLADQPVGLINVELASIFSTLEGKVSAAEVTAGRVAERQVVVTAANLGDANATGPVTVTDKLPVGLRAAGIEASAGASSFTGTRGPVSCSSTTLSCTFASGTLPPYDQIEVRVGVVVEGSAGPGEVNEATVSGGGAASASIRRGVSVSETATPFGVENFELAPEEEGGAVDTQAGSHPFQLTTSLALNEVGGPDPAALPKDLAFKWPAGLVGNPSPFPKCTLGRFLAKVEGKGNLCSTQSVVGVSMVTYNEPNNFGVLTETEPVFNLEPAKGEPARFGFITPIGPVLIDPTVRSGEDYGITVHVDNITQVGGVLRAVTTIWGVPGDARHDQARGYGCLEDARQGSSLFPCNALGESNPPSFVSLPSSCPGSPAPTSVQADAWQAPGAFTSLAGTGMPALDGCNHLPFTPSITVAADGHAASTPSGLTTVVRVPQAESLNPHGLAEGDVKNITVALPEGVQLNPAAADGLQSCSLSQIGFTGVDPGTGTDLFSSSEPSCPDASKVGTALIRTPLLPNPLKGFVYLAAPQNTAGAPMENPFQSLVAMYIVVKDPESGVLVKLPGSVSLSETGQITATFNDTPQVPFEEAELEFFGGDRAPLATPAKCGTYTTNAVFAPWSGEEHATAASSFQITQGPNGTPCPSPLPFAPSLAAGTTNINAGSFSPLTTTISREDGNQGIQTVQLHMPPGLSGILAGVTLCPEAQANTGTCGPGSLIGETIVSVGLGGDPFSVTGGKVYLTEKYGGAPFGLSIVNPAKAGPFNLQEGRPVVVRARIEIDPHTAALTITTGAIPHIIDGIPLQIKRVNVTITRPGFTFNPTSCNPAAITGTITSTENTSSPVSVPFQVTNCANLKFAPKFQVTTSAHTSKATGASLSVKLTYPKAPQGTQANIAMVKVDLPKQLPSQLKTLQKACLAATFETNPASCPAPSIVGHAKVTTPLLPVPLEGPAYFVSHGGEAFPSLTIVLQGYGVTVNLTGATLIRKSITSTTFNTVPDVPFNTFELTLPQGKYAALAANLPPKAKNSFCNQKLVMPTLFKAQNGQETRQNTPIKPTGCTKPKTKKTKAKKPSHKK
jgi:hypothetical protein